MAAKKELVNGKKTSHTRYFYEFEMNLLNFTTLGKILLGADMSFGICNYEFIHIPASRTKKNSAKIVAWMSYSTY